MMRNDKSLCASLDDLAGQLEAQKPEDYDPTLLFPWAMDEDDEERSVRMGEQGIKRTPQRKVVFHEGVVLEYARQFEAARAHADSNWDSVDPRLPPLPELHRHRPVACANQTSQPPSDPMVPECGEEV